MPRKMNIDYKAFLEMVNQDVPQKEIMEKLEIKNITQFKNAYLNALMEDGQVKRPKGGRVGRKTKPVSRKIKINNRGSLVIPKKLTEALGLELGQEFTVKSSKAGLSLKKVTEDDS